MRPWVRGSASGSAAALVKLFTPYSSIRGSTDSFPKSTLLLKHSAPIVMQKGTRKFSKPVDLLRTSMAVSAMAIGSEWTPFPIFLKTSVVAAFIIPPGQITAARSTVLPSSKATSRSSSDLCITLPAILEKLETERPPFS